MDGVTRKVPSNVYRALLLMKWANVGISIFISYKNFTLSFLPSAPYWIHSTVMFMTKVPLQLHLQLHNFSNMRQAGIGYVEPL